MPTVHFLNVGQGDCSIIQHGSGHVSVIDICGGKPEEEKPVTTLAAALEEARVKGNFRMCDKPTNPVHYLKELGVSRVFRFILSHPDMDHLDGFKALVDEIGITNFWDSGVRREKPDFTDCPQYREADWDEYIAVRDGNRSGVTVVTPKAGSKFAFANRGEGGSKGGDGLSIASPDQARVDEVNKVEDCNGGSYIVTYHTSGGKIIFPGDAHDKGWELATSTYLSSVSDCSVLIAPHHGRDSDRSWDFLDKIKPKLALFGCAPSEHLAYAPFYQRNIPIITNNQAGNIILDCDGHGIDVYVQNQKYAEKRDGYDQNKTLHGCYYIGFVPKPKSV